MRLQVLGGIVSLLIVVCVFQGCGKAPQITSANREILEALQTAVSAKKPEWLSGVESRVTEQHTKQEMSETEFKAFRSILDKAKAGQWKVALNDSLTLSEGQRPTAADLAQLKDRKSAKRTVPKRSASRAGFAKS